jgi:hypothetical protein
MAEFKLGRIRFVWKGEWSAATTYYKDDVIRYGGKTYICTVGHTSDSDFNVDLNYSPDRWNQLSDGQAWRGDWNVSTAYKVRDIVKYGGRIYICKTGHTSAATTTLGLEADQDLPSQTNTKWELFAEGIDWKNSWSTSTRYKVRDVVKYGGYTYVCNEGHTSAATAGSGLEADSAKWDTFNPGIEYKSGWLPTTRYKLNDVVKYGADLWICITQHTSSSSFITDEANWNKFVEGFQFENEWDVGTTYQPGDVVRYGGNQYIAKTNHSGSTPSTGTSNWDLFTEGFNFQADWSSVTAYKIGDIVRLRGYTYLAVADNTNQEPPNLTYWERLNSGLSWRGAWIDDVEYKLGDVVRYGANAYICVLGHRSEGDDGSTIGPEGGGAANSRPDQDTSGTYWNTLTVGSETAVLTTRGDMVYYSENGPTRLPIGREGQVLRAGQDAPEWVTLGEVDQLYFVAEHGTDLPAPIWGKTWDKPWKTIRYACEQVENGARYPNAKKLIELNRAFIQREVTAWIREQIDTNTAPFSSSFVYEDYKCERDVGFVIDRIINDIGQGGNLKVRAAVQTFFNALDDGPFSNEDDSNGTGPYNNLAVEAAPSSAAYSYMLSLIENVLDNEAPSTIYQNVTDDSTTIVSQYFNSDLVAESSAVTEINNLVGLITTAFDTYSNTAGSDSVKRAAAVATIPARYVPQKLIRVATGRYRETLPIIVPAYTCVQGDELRSTNAGPAGSLIDISDSYYTVTTFDRFSDVVSTLVTGGNVTPTTGNTEIQNDAFPYADSQETTDIAKLVDVMKHDVDFRLNTLHASYLTDPTGYNTSYLAGYGDARKLIKENKAFLQEEVVEYLQNNWATLEFTGSISGTTMTVTEVDQGTIGIGMVLKNGGIVSGTTVVAQLTGTTGGTGTYTVSESHTLPSTTIKGENKYSRTLTRRDAGYIIDAIVYDLTYGGNALSVQAGLAYYDGDDNTQPQIPAAIKQATLASINFLKGRMQDVALNNTISALQSRIPQYRDTAGSAGASTLIGNNIDEIIDIVDNGPSAATLTDPTPSNGVNTSTTLINEYNLLEGGDDFDQVKDVVEAYLATNYSDVDYSVAKARRDAGIILKAIGFDFMFNSNYQTIKAAHAYRRGTASELFDTDDRIKEATRNSLLAARDEALNIISDSTAETRLTALYDLVDTIVYGGSNEGDVCQTNSRNRYYAVLQLERNRDFIVEEIRAYISETFSDTVTNTTATTNVITISDTSWLKRNTAIRFSGTTFGGISADTTYYVQKIIDGTTFAVASTRNAGDTSRITLTTASGSMSVSLYYNQDLCLRDVNTYIDAIKWDLIYSSNYKSKFVARYYANAVKGSLEEDMFYLRDATGLRDMTLADLTGDLTTENAYGTSRVTAGAYASLDPGWGPADFRTWILSRSPYVQGITTFGNAAVGQKIDGALHNGGNDSIVSNDFTQVISDGIGAWVTNNGRAELVSVFTYYSHIGYLSEAGGRIRGTNGNNSYGDFGSVAEGFDSRETPNTAVVDNRFSFKAVIDTVNTTGSSILNFEFENAGIDYTEISYIITGGGTGAEVEANEFRDDGVFQVRLLELAPAGEDGEFGGSGYTTNSNTAQGGTSSSITLSATDDESNTAYIGMKIVLTGGAGVGQFAIINSYNSGTKVAGVIKESDGTAGWDHLVTGTTIVNPDASTTYTIEPRISFSSPGFSNTAISGLPSGDWKSIVFGATSTTYTAVSTGIYSGTGASGATFNVIRNGYKYIVTLNAAGTGYTRLETITIGGSDLGGAATTNDLVITITSVNSITGAIIDFDYEGFARGGRFAAVKGGSTDAGAYSDDGSLWYSMTLPSTGDWSAIAHGIVQDGSSVNQVSRFVALRTGSDEAAWSEDGINWTASTMPASTGWASVTFGEGKFVAISSSGTEVAISADGEIWDSTGTLPSTGFVDVTYGRGKFVAVKTGDTGAVAYSDTGTGNWTADDMPASSAWISVSFGNNMFVAVASDSNSGAYSIDGETWSAMTMGSLDGSSVAGYQKVRYGQSLFMTTAYLAGEAGEGYSYVNTSQDGITWTVQGVAEAASPGTGGYNAIAFGTPQRTGYWVITQYTTGSYGTRIRTGATAKARASVADGKIFIIRILEPGSGYSAAPTITVTDPSNLYEVPTSVRIGKGVVANPTFINRGNSYTTGSADVADGDGYADFYQSGSFVSVRRITERPVPGSNVVFSHLPNKTFKLVNVITFLGSNDGSYRAFYQVSPNLTISEAPEHLEDVTTRILYSQVRLTGHDFLDIGTGSFTDTNYPGTATQAPVPDNETVESNGGRVFFTATDQDGNFRVGNLFAIEQSTGIATLNADAFNISGLQELNLGNVTLGGGSATITEFSTDPFFTADSDNIIPTQRAIKAYIASQIGGGGASINVNSVTAGSIQISSNVITTTSGTSIQMNANFEFRGGVTGLPIAFNYFLT